MSSRPGLKPADIAAVASLLHDLCDRLEMTAGNEFGMERFIEAWTDAHMRGLSRVLVGFVRWVLVGW
jgi:hypothetical protein